MAISSSGDQAVDALNGKLTFEQDKNRIVGRDAENRIRLLILADGDQFLMKIAKVGKDAIADGDTDMIFNSNQNALKVVTTGTASLTGSSNISAGTTQTVTVAHNLGYIPALLIYTDAVNVVGLQGGGGLMNLPVPYILPNTTGGIYMFFLQARVDATNLYLDLVCVGGSNNNLAIYTWDFKYYLLQETAN